MIYIKTGNMLGFQFAPVPLPPFQSLLFIRDSGWNPLFTSPMTHLSSLNHEHLSCKPQAFEELRCEVWEAEMRHWNCRNVQGFHPLPRINRRVRKGGRGTSTNFILTLNNIPTKFLLPPLHIRNQMYFRAYLTYMVQFHPLIQISTML